MRDLSRMCFFFNDTATTEIYTLSLHDALPISGPAAARRPTPDDDHRPTPRSGSARSTYLASSQRHTVYDVPQRDRKSTRLNSSHANISYAVFCLKKKNKQYTLRQRIYTRQKPL